jgi:predicted MPP superfamily phosphohydrolase
MNLHTLAGDADQTDLQPRKVLFLKSIGLYLGVPMAESNPRRVIKRSKENLGNTPLEVLTYLATYFEELFTNKTLSTPVHQTMSKSMSMNYLALLTDVLDPAWRESSTRHFLLRIPISIAQITWA